jgi:hypothetical protein
MRIVGYKQRCILITPLFEDPLMPLSFKLIGAGLLLTLFGLFSSLSEIRLALFGTKVKAVVFAGWVASDRDSGAVKRYELEYRFQDESGRDYKNSFTAGPEFNPLNATVDVVYLKSSPDTNKLASKSGWKSYLALVAGIVLTALGGWYFSQESVNQAHADTDRAMRNMENNSVGGRR